jgi:DNA polymerase-3 subunit epsilon/oligoribonuclease
MYWALIAKENAEEGHPFPEEINLSKNEIAKRRQLPTEAEPHRAMRGVEHLILCYRDVVGLKVPLAKG